MTRSILSALFAMLFSMTLLAQSLEDIKELAGKNEWAKAKEGIDKFLANPKNAKKGEGWFLKAQVYNLIAKAENAATLFPGDARAEAYAAYKTYLEVDSKAMEGTINQHSPLFDIAFGYQQKATDNFNAKKFDEALTAFLDAEKVEDYIVQKKFIYGTFSFAAFDTQLYINIAAAAINAKKEEVAVNYYKKVVDQKMVDKGYDEIYRFVVDYYVRINDKANRDKYLAIGKEVFPNDDYWCEVGLKEFENDKKGLFIKYEELMSSGCDKYYTLYNYCVELFNYSFTGEKKLDDKDATVKRLGEVLTKAIDLKKEGVEAKMLMCRYHLAIVKDLGDSFDAIRGTKPEDLKKRSEINATISKKFDDAYPYMNGLYEYFSAKSDLKNSEKGTFRIVTSMLTEYWEVKKDKVKTQFFSDKIKEMN